MIQILMLICTLIAMFPWIDKLHKNFIKLKYLALDFVKIIQKKQESSFFSFVKLFARLTEIPSMKNNNYQW